MNGPSWTAVSKNENRRRRRRPSTGYRPQTDFTADLYLAEPIGVLLLTGEKKISTLFPLRVRRG